MRTSRWLLTIMLTLLIPSVRALGATSACGSADGHQMPRASARTSFEVVDDAGTTRDCGTSQPHTSGNNCTSMQACTVGVAVPEAPRVSARHGVESSQAFPTVAFPRDRATLPQTPPPR
jgi:hypothetical protein